MSLLLARRGEGKAHSVSTSPPVTAGLVTFIDASQIVGKNDGDAITSLTELSSNALVLTNFGTGSVLYHTSRTPNGKPAIVFNGSNRLATGNVTLGISSGITMLAVAKRSSIADYDAIASKQITSSGNFDQWGRSDGAVQFQWANGLNLNSAGGWNDTNYHRFIFGAGTSGTPGAFILKDGTTLLSNTTGVCDAENNNPLYVGGRSDGGTDLNGEIAALLIYSRMLSSTEYLSVDSWMNARFGV